MLAAVKLKRARDRQSNKWQNKSQIFKVGDLIPLRNHKKETPWDTKYMLNFIVAK